MPSADGEVNQTAIEAGEGHEPAAVRFN